MRCTLGPTLVVLMMSFTPIVNLLLNPFPMLYIILSFYVSLHYLWINFTMAIKFKWDNIIWFKPCKPSEYCLYRPFEIEKSQVEVREVFNYYNTEIIDLTDNQWTPMYILFLYLYYYNGILLDLFECCINCCYCSSW